jgi:hypothetical protein
VANQRSVQRRPLIAERIDECSLRDPFEKITVTRLNLQGSAHALFVCHSYIFCRFESLPSHLDFGMQCRKTLTRSRLHVS